MPLLALHQNKTTAKKKKKNLAGVNHATEAH